MDWLATDFVKRNYDVKELTYLITTSNTYQLPTVGMKYPNKITDKNFRFRGMLWWRLSAEQFADAVSKAIYPVYSESALKYNPYEKKERSMEQSYMMLNSPEAKAFDLSTEPKESYDTHKTGKFGLGCLLAKRLTEEGARFITVTTEYVLFLGLDTHENGHTRVRDMKA